MKTCIRCKKEFDPSMEFIEDEEMLEALAYYSPLSSIYDICPSCSYGFDAALNEAAEEFFQFVTKSEGV